MMTPRANVSDRSDQINQNTFLNSIISYDKLKLIRKPEVLALTCISKSTLHLRIKDLTFPSPVYIGDRAVAFVEYEVLTVIAAQIKGNKKDEIRSIVQGLISQRQNLHMEMKS